MKLIIDIDEIFYEGCKKGMILDTTIKYLVDSIANGTPLPKGHGRLIDADATLKRHCTELCEEKPSCYEDCLIYDLLHLAPTIIEADTESEDKE